MAYRTSDQGVAVAGFDRLRTALARLGGAGEFGVEYELDRRLKTIGEHVAAAAPGFVTHKTGRHGDPTTGPLEDSVRVSVTKRRASVYSTSVYGGAQQSGAGPKAGWEARGPHIQRKDASKWMGKAVASERAFIQGEMDGLLDWVVSEFEHDR